MENLDLDEDFLFHLVDPQSFAYIVDEGISPELIPDPLVKSVFQWQISYYQQYGQCAPAQVIENEFIDKNVKLASSITHIDDLISRIKQRYGFNEGQKAIRSASHLILDNPREAGMVMVDAGRDLIKKLSPQREIFTETDIDKAILHYHKRAIKGRGPSFGFREMDDYFYGLNALTFLIAPVKAMKSWFTVKSALENIKEGKKVMIYPLELPAEITDARLHCMAAHIPFRKYLHAEFSDQDLKEFKEAGEILQSFGSFIIEKPKEGQRTVNTLYQKAIDNGCDILYIDQLQYIESKNGIPLGATNDTKDYFAAINQLKDLADDGIPIWIVHQFNRSVLSNKKDEFPDVRQAKGSSAVEETATLVLGLYANQEMRENDIIQIGTLASRNHTPAKWNIHVNMRQRCDLEMIGRDAD